MEMSDTGYVYMGLRFHRMKTACDGFPLCEGKILLRMKVPFLNSVVDLDMEEMNIYDVEIK